jgi:hypothetical protein
MRLSAVPREFLAAAPLWVYDLDNEFARCGKNLVIALESDSYSFNGFARCVIILVVV